MKGIRFFEELEHKNRKAEQSQGNVIAMLIGSGFWRQYASGDRSYHYECVGAVFYHPNSQCAGTSAQDEYLRGDCRRISEARAREIHPALFEYLDRES